VGREGAGPACSSAHEKLEREESWASGSQKENRPQKKKHSAQIPKRGGGKEINVFPILFSNLCLIRFQENLKTFLKFKTTTQTKINATTCMLKHVSRPYSCL